MALPGETVSTGAPGPDDDENIKGPQVMHSAAGYYIGYSIMEDFGGGQMYEVPYSRESGYYPTKEAAEADLKSYEPRNTDYNPGTLEVTEIDTVAGFPLMDS